MRGLPLFANHPMGFADARAARGYRGIALHVVDGDTADFLFDMGKNLFHYDPVRIADFKAPELFRGTPEERAEGQAYREAAGRILLSQEVTVQLGYVFLRTEKDDQTFNRYIAGTSVWDVTGERIPFAEAMRREGCPSRL